MKLNPIKQCQNCGNAHDHIPENAKPQLDYDGKETVALIWNCTCGTTLVKLVKQLKPRPSRILKGA